MVFLAFYYCTQLPTIIGIIRVTILRSNHLELQSKSPFCNYLQTQSCYWRSTSKNSRSRRETEGIEEEEKAVNETMSESLNLFQAIHVLQSNEDEADYRNQTNAGMSKSE